MLAAEPTIPGHTREKGERSPECGSTSRSPVREPGSRSKEWFWGQPERDGGEDTSPQELLWATLRQVTFPALYGQTLEFHLVYIQCCLHDPGDQKDKQLTFPM